MLKDLTGQKFGRLTVLERAENRNGKTYWRCLCDCGNFCVIRGSHLKSGRIKSCGCLIIEAVTKHGMYKTKIYRTWQNMLKRCCNKNFEDFDNYGGRGIKVCERWKIFENFYEDVSKLPHFGDPGYTLDRIDNNGDYCPENVRWADSKTQNRNTRRNIFVEYNGEEMCLTDAAKKSGITFTTLLYRYRKGLRSADLFKPVQS